MRGDTGRQLFGSLKTFTVTPPTPRETNLTASPITLPTAQPGAPTISYTIQQADIDGAKGVFSPTPLNFIPVMAMVITGKIGAVATTINYLINVNGVQSQSGNKSNLTAANFWTFSITDNKGFNCKVGDVIDIYLWSSQSDTTLDYHAIVVNPTRVELSKRKTVLVNVSYTATSVNASNYPSAPNPVYVNDSFSVGVVNNYSLNFNASVAFDCVSQQAAVGTNPSVDPLGLFNPYFGDSGYRATVNQRVHATNHPWLERNNFPQTISFRELIGG